MVTLSLAMIVRNEAETIERVLSCAKPFCDELVVVDTGSTDDTVARAKGLGATVHHFEWIDDFAAARNESFSKATGDWVLWLDADDVITAKNQQRLLELKSRLNDSVDGVMATYQYAFDVSGNCSYSLLRERLLRREAGLKWQFAVHESIALPSGRLWVCPEIEIQHRPLPEKQPAKMGRNSRILEKQLEKGDTSARTLFYLANELRDQKRIEEALPYYRQYLAVSKATWEKYEALLSLGDGLLQTGQREEAQASYGQAISLDSTRAEAYVRLGTVFYNEKQWQQAIPFFKSALNGRKPDFGFVREGDYGWIPCDYLGVCYERIKDYQQAIQYTLKALDGNPEKSRLIKNLHVLVDKL